MKVKKLTSLFLASAMIFSLTACGNSKDASVDISGADAGVQSDFNAEVDDAFLTVVKPEELTVGTMSDADVNKTKEQIVEKLLAESEYESKEAFDKEMNEDFPVTHEEYTETLNAVSSSKSENFSDSKSVVFSFNGKSVTYPFDLSVFEDAGWEITEHGKEYTLIDSCNGCDFSYTKGDFAEAASSLILYCYGNDTYVDSGNYAYLQNNGVYGFDYTSNSNVNFTDYLQFSVNDFCLIGNSYSDFIKLCEEKQWSYTALSDNEMIVDLQFISYQDANNNDIYHFVSLYVTQQDDKINSIKLSCN